MRQIVQNLKTGQTALAEVPCPRVGRGQLLIRTSCSLVSAGTERMLVDFGRANLFEKARRQPDKVKMVLEKVKTDGMAQTLESVRSKLEQPLALGYCNVGMVLEVGAGVSGFSVGDRLVSNGKHAEVVSVPKNLCAKVPKGVSDEAAAFTVLGAIALQGIRLTQPTLGEVVVVTGLGLIGLLTVQLLRAHGCRVLGIDRDASRISLARTFGAEAIDLSKGENTLTAAATFSRGRGVDAVIVTAATRSSEPMHEAALMCRKRGRIVLVGVVGLELSRADFYEKELTFQVSCSYGPGRYDPLYEESGQDYPVGFVRWTEQRNFEAVLDMLAGGRLDVTPLISHRFALAEAERAYEVVAGAEPSLGILLAYPRPQEKPDEVLQSRTVRLVPSPQPSPDGEWEVKPVVSFVGAGNYATAVLIPAFKQAGVGLRSIASSGGVSGVHAGRKYGFEETTTDTDQLLADGDTNAVVITTRHDTHARFVLQALRAGKHVFVEKPLCLTLAEIKEIGRAYGQVVGQPSELCEVTNPGDGAAPRGGREVVARPILMVGFNRRFSPFVQRMKALLDSVKSPKAFVMTVNAGEILPEHWTQDREIGGGRIIGEACHFVDLLRFLADAPVTRVQAAMMGEVPGVMVRDDKVTFTLAFADGSFGTVHYLSNGHRSFPKERLEVFAGGRILQLDNFRRLRAYGWPGFRGIQRWRQDKGNRACAAAFVEAVRRGGPSPIPFEELMEVTRVTFDVVDALKRR